jgi:peptide/nickel transport system ATP-binding protein
MSRLIVDALSIARNGKSVVAPISFILEKGESITILGETGSGKSLFAKAIIGDLPNGFETEGRIELDGQALHTLSRQQRAQYWGKKIAILPQEPRLALSPLMTIGEQIKEVYHSVVGQNKTQAMTSTMRDVESMHLVQDDHKFPVELSGGMAQRTAFLCAKAAGGSLLIADEPTKGLDPVSKDQVIELLLNHKKEQGSLITITHDLHVAKALGGNIFVLYNGEWLARGKRFSEWQADQTDHYSQALLAAQTYQGKDPSLLAEIRKPLLHASKLSVTFGGRTLFRDLSFSLHQGEVLGLSGPSGCGKSTLCDFLLRLRSPTEGKVECLTEFTSGQKLKLYQDPPQSFSSAFTLQRQIDDLCHLHHLAPQQIIEYCARLALHPDILQRYSHQVSGGELQRIAILRVLLLKPKLLIADEPTTRLDPHIAQETLRLLISTVKEIGCALVLVSHNRDELNRYCHSMINFTETGEALRKVAI